MMRKLLFVLICILALLGGSVAGDLFRGKPPIEAGAEAEASKTTEHGQDTGSDASSQGSEVEVTYFRFPNQFFIPIMQNGDTFATMILTLSLEIPSAASEKTFAREHKLRDALLRALMIHANTGGFSGNYTSDVQMEALRAALLKAAKDVADVEVSAILVEDIARQMQ
ncbi:hypothetical protein [Paracoccus sp. (in: a-proteobacteria)]|uniref:hypothetical protein n=1 Tax=Paracoccus sp. TaxID=267 RepID=UPI0028977EF2|nr:hypothetical protein [Paracoccus sp. (in: a-proteobacteria)]